MTTPWQTGRPVTAKLDKKRIRLAIKQRREGTAKGQQTKTHLVRPHPPIELESTRKNLAQHIRRYETRHSHHMDRRQQAASRASHCRKDGPPIRLEPCVGPRSTGWRGSVQRSGTVPTGRRCDEPKYSYSSSSSLPAVASRCCRKCIAASHSGHFWCCTIRPLNH